MSHDSGKELRFNEGEPMVPTSGTAETATLIIAEEAALTIAISEEQLRDFEAQLAEIVAASEAALAKLRELVGPVPGPVSGIVLHHVEQGTRHYRGSRDSLRAWFRELSKFRRAQEAAAQSEIRDPQSEIA